MPLCTHCNSSWRHVWESVCSKKRCSTVCSWFPHIRHQLSWLILIFSSLSLINSLLWIASQLIKQCLGTFSLLQTPLYHGQSSIVPFLHWYPLRTEYLPSYLSQPLFTSPPANLYLIEQMFFQYQQPSDGGEYCHHGLSFIYKWFTHLTHKMLNIWTICNKHLLIHLFIYL